LEPIAEEPVCQRIDIFLKQWFTARYFHQPATQLMNLPKDTLYRHLLSTMKRVSRVAPVAS
jgi:hypothetical protein